ncbi:MAG: toxin-antitoxin system protein [Armatimonadetes bacterium]|nr:toxin-antitoxin system protein [Armatimonadota bacterium]
MKELAVSQKSSLQQVLDQAVEHYQRHRLLEQINADYAALRQDPDAWEGLQQERAAWDATLMDGLDPEETWTEDGNVRKPR